MPPILSTKVTTVVLVGVQGWCCGVVAVVAVTSIPATDKGGWQSVCTAEFQQERPAQHLPVILIATIGGLAVVLILLATVCRLVGVRLQ